MGPDGGYDVGHDIRVGSAKGSEGVGTVATPSEHSMATQSRLAQVRNDKLNQTQTETQTH